MKLRGAPTETETPIQENNDLNLYVNTEIYAKKLPNFSSNDIWKLEKNKQVKKTNEINNWVEITDGQNTGWILKNKLQNTIIEENPDDANTSSNDNATNETTNTTNTANVANTSSATNITNTTNNTTSTNTNNTTSNSTTSSLNKKATITVETAKVREKATTESEVLGFLDYGDEITLLEKEGEWYKINFEGKTGYVKNTLLKIVEDTTVSSRSLTEERQETEAKSSSSEVVEYAKQYLGYPYVVGGKTPATGFDCSGFTRYIFLKFGYSLGTTASSQQNVGEEVSRENLMPGDLIIFLNEEKTGVGHTGIYIGNAEFIHSANPQRGVVIDNINTNSYYNERFVSARRIVQ